MCGCVSKKQHKKRSSSATIVKVQFSSDTEDRNNATMAREPPWPQTQGSLRGNVTVFAREIDESKEIREALSDTNRHCMCFI